MATISNIKEQCLDRNVNFFFKQWGAFGADGLKGNKKANGRMLEGVTWEMVPTLRL